MNKVHHPHELKTVDPLHLVRTKERGVGWLGSGRPVAAVVVVGETHAKSFRSFHLRTRVAVGSFEVVLYNCFGCCCLVVAGGGAAFGPQGFSRGQSVLKRVTESSLAEHSQLIFVKDFGFLKRVSERTSLFRVVKPQALETESGQRDESHSDNVHRKALHQVDCEFCVELEQNAREHVSSLAQSGLATFPLETLSLARGVGKALLS